MNKYITIENLDNETVAPVLHDGIPHAPSEPLKLWIKDLIADRFYGLPVSAEQVAKPLNTTDLDQVVVYVVGGDRYLVSMSPLSEYLAKLKSKENTHHEQ